MSVIKLLIGCAVLVLVAAAQEITISVPLSTEEVDEVTFNPTRVSAADVSRWIKLSEEGPYDQADIGIGVFFAEPPSGSTKKQKEIHDAQVKLNKLRKRISDLGEGHYPVELSEVVSYLRRVQSFWVWLDNQKLAFLETGDVSVLQSPFDQIDPKSSCGAVLERIRNAKDQKEAWHLACFDWHNCVLKAGEKQIGPYPENAWHSFLAAYGIREHIGSTETD